jgi:DNA repair protein RecO (recombination protein O)
MGEYHKSVTLLTETMGIVNAIAHGAQKNRSRLRGATESFCLSTVYLYRDPVKNVYKITDMVVRRFFESLRKNLVLYYTATLWTEVIIKSYGGGDDDPDLFSLYIACLELLNKSESGEPIYISVQFLWRFLRLCGFDPALGRCDQCGRSLATGEPAALNRQSTGFLCRDCNEDSRFVLDPGARRFLQRSTRESLEQALRYRVSDASLDTLKGTLYRLLQGLLETGLNSLEYAQGII